MLIRPALNCIDSGQFSKIVAAWSCAPGEISPSHAFTSIDRFAVD